MVFRINLDGVMYRCSDDREYLIVPLAASDNTHHNLDTLSEDPFSQTNFATSASIDWGVVVDAQRFTTLPSLSIKNFSKFHCHRKVRGCLIDMDLNGTLIRVNPSKPDFSFFRYLYTSFVLSPLTSDFFMSGKLTPWFSSQNDAISASLPGSCPPN